MSVTMLCQLIFFLLCLPFLPKAKLLKATDHNHKESKTPLDEEPLNLTPLIASGEIKKARSMSSVNRCLFAGVESHAAFINVNETFKWNMFFWYFPVEGKPRNSTPLVIWLEGGPGVPSTFGLFQEIGPLEIKEGKAVLKEISWGSNYSLLFIDNPAGTGFSYTETDTFATNQDMVGAGLLSFLQQFLQVFPELRSAPLFLSGSSYAGKYITAFGRYIHRNQDITNPINLKGMAIGNGWLDPPNMLHYGEFFQQIGIVSFQKADTITKTEDRAREQYNKNHDVQEIAKAFDNTFNIAAAELSNISIYNYLKKAEPDDERFITFLNKPETRKALHVGGHKTSLLNETVQDVLVAADNYLSINPWLQELLEHYHIMCYSGQLDLLVPYPVSVHGYRNLTWSGREQYLKAERKQIVSPDHVVYGYMTEAGNFLEVMVIGAGHIVPKDKPRAAKFVFDMFVSRVLKDDRRD